MRPPGPWGECVEEAERLSRGGSYTTSLDGKRGDGGDEIGGGDDGDGGGDGAGDGDGDMPQVVSLSSLIASPAYNKELTVFGGKTPLMTFGVAMHFITSVARCAE